MKKRFLNLLLALALVVCVLPMAADADTCTHVWKYKAPVAATCTADGWKGGDVCENCDAPRTASNVIPAAHTWQRKAAVAATCTTDGWKGGDVCNVCDAPRNESNIIPATGKHDYKFSFWPKKGEEATCTESAVGVFKCEVCGDYENITVKALEHEFKGKETVTLTATCARTGKKTVQCTRCTETEEVDIPQLEHTRVNVEEVPATCTQAGKTAGVKCSVCNKPFSGLETIPATGKHDYKFISWAEKGKEATCTESAVGVHKCAICGDYENITVKALGHDFTGTETITKTATCAREGTKTIKCTRCDEVEEKKIDKLPHNYVDVDEVPATCAKDGKTAGKQCSSCKRVLSGLKTIPATGKHTYELDFWAEEGKVATCEENAIGVFECSVCGDRENITVYALGHDWDITVLKEASCNIKGMEFHQCKREGCAVWKYVEIDALEHNKVVVDAVAPTCTATGLTAGEKCSVCGEVFTAQTVVEKLPHAWEDVEAQDPTCKADGYNAHKACTECGETDGKTVIPASAAYHEYENFKCKHCGAYDPSHQHQGTGVVTTESTCTAEGVKSFECTGCGHTWTESVAKKPHTYNAKARCTECGALDPDHQHNYVQTDYRAPTCTVEGKVTKKCSVCDDLTETLIDANGHSYENGKCVGCGIAAACAHDHTTTTVESNPTCKRAGKKVTTCDSCGKTVGTEVIPATGKHNYVNNRCTGCGQNDPSRITNDFQDVFIVG